MRSHSLRPRPGFPATTLQQGSFLLEALVAILIVALGVLGTVGLMARSMQDVDDAKNRGEAAYLANSLIGQMWIDDRTTAALALKYSKASAGTGYAEFKSLVEQRLPEAATQPQDVVVAAGPSPTSTVVTITVRWRPPGDKLTVHQHVASATIAANNGP